MPKVGITRDCFTHYLPASSVARWWASRK